MRLVTTIYSSSFLLKLLLFFKKRKFIQVIFFNLKKYAYYYCNFLASLIGHTWRLNGDLADTALQKSYEIFANIGGQTKIMKNLYCYKQYIFNVKKIIFFLLKSEKMILAVPKNGQS